MFIYPCQISAKKLFKDHHLQFIGNKFEEVEFGILTH